eukprot:6189039-Pleurochrysis_carterae.AAC.2
MITCDYLTNTNFIIGCHTRRTFRDHRVVALVRCLAGDATDAAIVARASMAPHAVLFATQSTHVHAHAADRLYTTGCQLSTTQKNGKSHSVNLFETQQGVQETIHGMLNLQQSAQCYGMNSASPSTHSMINLGQGQAAPPALQPTEADIQAVQRLLRGSRSQQQSLQMTASTPRVRRPRPVRGEVPNIEWRALSLDELREHPRFLALPPVLELQMAGPPTFAYVRQDDPLWDELHDGVLTSRFLSAVLGFREPRAAAHLGLPRGMLNPRAMHDAYEYFRACNTQHRRRALDTARTRSASTATSPCRGGLWLPSHRSR